ncbi:MAG TPA: hypothetical protein VFI27_19995 [candidate division Zixibacteria bacterium]|nr:hypothetical protein [candidate division Zixibacteria bacterium]
MEQNAMTTFCRVCHSRIRFDAHPDLFDIVTCPECDEAFEVVGLSPIQLDWPSDFGDDDKWSDADNDDGRFDGQGKVPSSS